MRRDFLKKILLIEFTKKCKVDLTQIKKCVIIHMSS